jgi:hypothetical protein
MKKLLNNKKAQITRATWIFILVIYFAVLSTFIVAVGETFGELGTESATLNMFQELGINFYNGISIIPPIISLLCFGIPFAFLVYLVLVSLIDAGS